MSLTAICSLLYRTVEGGEVMALPPGTGGLSLPKAIWASCEDSFALVLLLYQVMPTPLTSCTSGGDAVLFGADHWLEGCVVGKIGRKGKHYLILLYTRYFFFSLANLR